LEPHLLSGILKVSKVTDTHLLFLFYLTLYKWYNLLYYFIFLAISIIQYIHTFYYIYLVLPGNHFKKKILDNIKKKRTNLFHSKKKQKKNKKKKQLRLHQLHLHIYLFILLYLEPYFQF
jgi:hypothetical protein